MKVELILDWSRGTPELKGLYFAAIQYGEGAGVYDFVNWNGENWELEHEGEVKGFIDMQSFKNQLNIQWPNFPEKSSSSFDDMGFEEV